MSLTEEYKAKEDVAILPIHNLLVNRMLNSALFESLLFTFLNEK